MRHNAARYKQAKNPASLGIDIRDPVPVVQPIPTKKVYSDAEIVLSNDWVPPVTIVPTNITTTQPEVASPGGRKKTSSVSFSLDSSVDGEPGQNQGKEDGDKQDTKKNKVRFTIFFSVSSLLHHQISIDVEEVILSYRLDGKLSG